MERCLIVVVAIGVLSCSPNTCEIDYSGPWTAAIGNSSYQGTGSRNIGIEQGDCAVVQKMQRDGVLTVKINGSGVFGGVVDDGSTSAAYGVVSVCSER